MSRRSLELKKRWDQGEVTYGAWLGLADPYVAEIMAGTGFDLAGRRMKASPVVSQLNWRAA